MNAQKLGRLGLSLAVALTGAALAPAAFGQDSPAAEAPEGPPLYRVEVIVFAYNQGDRGEEDFRHIARSEALEASQRRSEIELLDFPYVDDEGGDDEGVGDEGIDEEADDEEALDGQLGASARSRLLLGQDEETDAAASTDPFESDAQVGPALDVDIDAGAAAEAGDVPLDPFGNDPGNAVAAFRFRLLDQEELELGGVRRRLEGLPDVYTPLVHGGWVQEGLPAQQAKPFDLAYLGASMPSGTIRLHVSRFLHLTLDLEYRPFIASAASSFAASGSPAAPGSEAPRSPSSAADFPSGDLPRQRVPGGERGGAVLDSVSPAALSEVEVSRRYHLNAERRMSNGEVHYFDHPFFGVIAVVEPYEPPEPAPTEGVGPAA